MTQGVEARLADLGITLPAAAAPAANYVPYILTGNSLFISGQLPMKDGAVAFAGKAVTDLSFDESLEAAKLCAINILAQAKAALGDLERIEQCLRLGGFVNAEPDFADHPKIINGASDLMVAALGDKGRHTRFAVGANSLPLNATVEIDALFSLSA